MIKGMKLPLKSRLFLILVLGALSFNIQAETSRKKLSVLSTSDTSSYGLGLALQNALATLYDQTGKYKVENSALQLEGFSPIEISRTMRELNSDTISFALLEQERISIFLFDSNYPFEFIVSSESLQDPAITSAFIEAQFRKAFDQIIQRLQANQFESLPSARSERVAQKMEMRKDKRVAQESRILFRELASQTDSPYHLGAQIGMSRFGAGGTSSSVVTFGLNGGYALNQNLSLDVGVSASTYVMASVGGRYWYPIGDKVVKIGVGFDIANVLKNITQNAGYFSPNLTYNNPPIRNGAFLVGPGVFFDIPLLGAALRGDLRILMGAGHTVFVGTYGFIYYI